MMKQIEFASLGSVDLQGPFKPSQFFASSGDYMSVVSSETVSFLQTVPVQLLAKIPNKADNAICHPTQKGVVVVRKELQVQMMDAIAKTPLGVCVLPGNCGAVHAMKFIDGVLHVLSATALYRISEDLKQVSQVCGTTELFTDAQVIITSFTGCVELNAYAVSAIVSGKPKTFFYNGKPSVVPDMLCSCMARVGGELFLCTSPFNELKVSAVNLTQMKPAKAALEAEPNEVVKALQVLPQHGLLVVFTSVMRIVVFDLFSMHELAQLKSTAMVGVVGLSSVGLTYVQVDGRIVQLMPEVSLLVSTLQNKLEPKQQYEHFTRTGMLGGLVKFDKIYKPYLEECFKQNGYQEMARIVADAIQYGSGIEVRTQQLVDKISLQDRKAFLLYASALVQIYKVKLVSFETLTLIRNLHQETMLASAFPKFIEQNYLEVTLEDERPGLLILELAGQPIPPDYAKLALQCFQAFGCHTKVVQFLLKNGNTQHALEYASRLDKELDFNFAGFLKEKYPSPEALRGDQKFLAQQEALMVLQSEKVSLQQKEELIASTLAFLDVAQNVIQYLTQLMQTTQSQEVQTLFTKALLLTADKNLPQIKGNLLTAIRGPLKDINRAELMKFCAARGHKDLQLLLGMESGDVQGIEDFAIADATAFAELLAKFDWNSVKGGADTVVAVASLIKESSNDITVFGITKVISSIPGFEKHLERIESCDERLFLELSKRAEISEKLFEPLVRQVIVMERPASSPLLGLTAVFEVTLKCGFTFESLSQKLQAFQFNSDAQRSAVAAVFAFLMSVSHCYKLCPKCAAKPLAVVGGEQLYDVSECVTDYVATCSALASRKAAFSRLLEAVGPETAAQKKDRFQRLGNMSVVFGMISVLLKRENTEDEAILEELFVDCASVMSQAQLTYWLIELTKVCSSSNCNQVAALIHIVIKETRNTTLKNTFSVIESIVQVVNGKVSEALQIDFNSLDPDAVVNAITAMQDFLLQDKDAIVGPATKVIDSLALLPSQAAEDYMVQFTRKALDIVDSNILLNKFAEKVARKQDTPFWSKAMAAIPQVVELVGEIGVKLSAVEVLSFAQAAVDAKELNFKHVKDTLKGLLPQTADKKFAQNILLQLDVRLGDEPAMLEDVEAYKEAVTLTVANLAVEHKLYKAASVIFKYLNNHVDAASCLLEHQLTEEAWRYAREVKDIGAWRVLCKHYLASDLEKAYEALKQTNQLLLAPELAREVLKSENVELHHTVAQYILTHRISDSDKFADSELAMLLAVCLHKEQNTDTVKQQLVALLGDQNTTINSQKLGDQCYVKEMFVPARFFYASARNYAAMNSVCMKVGDFLGALQATARINQKDVWTEFRNDLLQQIVTADGFDSKKLLYFFAAQLNLLTTTEELLTAQKLPLELRHLVMRAAAEAKSRNVNCVSQNIQTLNQTLTEITRPMMADYEKEKAFGFQNVAGLALNEFNEKIFDITVGIYANNKELNQELLPFLKKFSKLVSIEFALSQAQKNGLSEIVTFCYCALGNCDEAVKTLVQSNGNLDQLIKLLGVTQTKPVHALAFKFILETHDDELCRFLPVFEKILSPDELMQVASLVEAFEEKLFTPYYAARVLNAETPIDSLCVNERFLSYLLRKKMVAEIRVAISKVNAYDKLSFAEQLVSEQSQLRIAAALLFNQIGQPERCISILIEEKEIDLAIQQLTLAKDRLAAARLLNFAAEADSEKLDEIMLVTQPILRLDQFLTIVWKHRKIDAAMPHIITSVAQICQKLEQ